MLVTVKDTGKTSGLFTRRKGTLKQVAMDEFRVRQNLIDTEWIKFVIAQMEISFDEGTPREGSAPWVAIAPITKRNRLVSKSDIPLTDTGSYRRSIGLQEQKFTTTKHSLLVGSDQVEKSILHEEGGEVDFGSGLKVVPRRALQHLVQPRETNQMNKIFEEGWK